MEELPLGFGMALAQNPAQWNIFKTDQGKAGGNFGTHAYNSIRNEMHAYVQSLAIFKPTAGAPQQDGNSLAAPR
ncbi:MAG: hypothetical protein ACLSF7_05830 [Acutalibacteraceae bacterium]